jgi:hypothetical protein
MAPSPFSVGFRDTVRTPRPVPVLPFCRSGARSAAVGMRLPPRRFRACSRSCYPSECLMGYVASVTLPPQAPLAGLEVEPDVPALPPPVGDDPANPTPALGGAARTGRLHRIRQRIAATLSRPAGDLLSARHRLGDPFLGEPRGHPRCQTACSWSTSRLPRVLTAQRTPSPGMAGDGDSR